MDSCDLSGDHLVHSYLTHGEVMGEPPYCWCLAGLCIFFSNLGGSEAATSSLRTDAADPWNCW